MTIKEAKTRIDWVEEVLFTNYSESWHGELPTTLITWKNGKQDLHRQTGAGYHEDIAKAFAILKERGLIPTGDEWIASSGIYHGLKNEH